LLAENEADASEIEGINALTEPDQIKGKTGVGEIGKGGPGTKDWNRIALERSKGMGDRKAKRE